MTIKYGDVFLADLSPVVGSEQGGIRPVLVIQNNVGNRFSPTVIVAVITTQIKKSNMPTHVKLQASKHGLERDSVVLLEQIRTIDKSRLKCKLTEIDEQTMEDVEWAYLYSLASPKYLAMIKSMQQEKQLAIV